MHAHDLSSCHRGCRISRPKLRWLLAQNCQPVTLLATKSRTAAARGRCDPIMRRGGCRGDAGAIHARERSGGSATRHEGDLDYQTTDLEGVSRQYGRGEEIHNSLCFGRGLGPALGIPDASKLRLSDVDQKACARAAWRLCKLTRIRLKGDTQ